MRKSSTTVTDLFTTAWTDSPCMPAEGGREALNDQLPDGMFKHLELVPENQRALTAETWRGEVVPSPVQKHTMTEQEFSLLSGIIRSAPYTVQDAAGGPRAITTPDVAEVISKLASLRDAGILSDDDFNAKKAELLNRLRLPRIRIMGAAAM